MSKLRPLGKDMDRRRLDGFPDFDSKSVRSLVKEEAPPAMNTYKLGPDPQSIFREGKAQKVMEDVLNKYLEKYQYDSKTCGNMCMQVANEIKQRTKQLGFFRYKIICQVIMFSLNRQSMRIASRFLWDEKSDRMIFCQYMGKTFGAIVTLSGCYFE